MKPRDPALYDRVKASLYEKQPAHSAYRSMRLQQLYKDAYAKAHGSAADAYIGRKPSRSSGTQRWLREQWINVKAFVTRRKVLPCGRSKDTGPYPACRPLRRVNRHTPVTVTDVIHSRGVRGVLRTVRQKERVRSRRHLLWK